MRLKLAHKVVIAIAIPVLFQIGFLCLLLKSVEQLDQLEKAERDVADVLVLRNQICIAEALVFLYYGLYRVSGRKEYRAMLDTLSAQHTSAFAGLKKMWLKDEVKLRFLKDEWMFARLCRMAFIMTADFPRATSMKDFFGPNPGGPGVALIQRNRGNLGKLFNSYEKEQDRLLKESQVVENGIKHEMLAALLASLIVTVATGWLFSKFIAVRLRKVVSNIEAMETPGAVLQKVGGNDEISALNDAVINTNEKIREAEQFQAQTARIVAQELERPLNRINDHVLDMRDAGFEKLNNNGEERIERSLLEITRLRSLVKDLISLDKISRIGWELEASQIDLADIARAAVDTVQDYAGQNRVELVLLAEKTLVTGDPARLQQIALNLLTNAIKFSKPKSTIEIATLVENQFGKLSVTDHGTGIPEEFQQKIFGHFEQVSRTDATEKGGSGLGLAISKRLVESQQGRMGFKSKLGEGSTFWFALPLAQSSTTAEDGSDMSQIGLQKLQIKPGVDTMSTRSNEASTSQSAASEAAIGKKRHEYRSTLWRNSLAMVLLPMMVQFATISIMWTAIGHIRGNVNEFSRLSQITSYHAKLMDALVKGILFSIIYNINHQEVFRYHMDVERGVASNCVDWLHEVSRSDAVLSKDSDSLEKMVHQQFALQDEIANARQDADVDPFMGPKTVAVTERKMAQVVFPLEQAMRQVQKLVDSNVLAKSEMREAVEQRAIFSALAMFAISVLLGVLMIRGLTARVQKIVENTKRLAAREPLQMPSGQKDEIGFVEESFFEAANKLTKLEQYKQELIALTSHEFRTPLTSLLAKADLMEAGVFGPLNQHGNEIVVKVKASITDLIALLTNLLDVEKIQSGKSLVVKEEVRIDEILDTTTKNVCEAIKGKELEFKVSGAGVAVNADATRLVQSLTAVLNDIMLYAPLRSTITLDAAKANGELNLTIRAPGDQCSSEALNSNSARGRLALDLLRLIAQQHGGQIAIDAGVKQLVVQVNLPA